MEGDGGEAGVYLGVIKVEAVPVSQSSVTTTRLQTDGQATPVSSSSRRERESLWRRPELSWTRTPPGQGERANTSSSVWRVLRRSVLVTTLTILQLLKTRYWPAQAVLQP